MKRMTEDSTTTGAASTGRADGRSLDTGAAMAGLRRERRRTPSRKVEMIAAALVGLIGIGIVLVQPSEAQVHQSEHHAFRVVSVAEGFENPWSIAFLPGGDMLVTERPGRLRIIRNGQLDAEPIQGVPEVRARNQGGLLDVALHPDFESNRLVYLSYSKPHAGGEQGTTAVIRGEFDGRRLNNIEEIFDARNRSSGYGHYGSRLAFDGNGHLFISLGDRQAPPRGDLEAHPSQDLTDHYGTVIRIHDDGRIPDDNPFVGRDDALPEIWSYGHRNGQGLAIHPETGDVWQNEHGPRGGDELNLVRPGRNYGWPVITYGINYNGSTITEETERPGMEQPAHYWVPSIATAGLMIYTGDRFPAWRGNIFVGGMAGEQLARLTMDGRRVVAEETLLEGEVGRIRDVRQGPDGYIYLVTDHRGGNPTPVVRLEPASDG